jgi:hypothetical protein
MKNMSLANKTPDLPSEDFTFFSLYNRHNYLTKIVSVILVCTFLFQEISFAQGPDGPSASRSTPSKTEHQINLRQFSIPRDLGVAKEAQIYDSKETIINIRTRTTT